jgi:hypothetical protein
MLTGRSQTLLRRKAPRAMSSSRTIPTRYLQGAAFQAWAVRPGQVDVAALDAQPVPTPGTLWLVGAGLLGLSLRRRRWALRRFV